MDNTMIMFYYYIIEKEKLKHIDEYFALFREISAIQQT